MEQICRFKLQNVMRTMRYIKIFFFSHEAKTRNDSLEHLPDVTGVCVCVLTTQSGLADLS